MHKKWLVLEATTLYIDSPTLIPCKALSILVCLSLKGAQGAKTFDCIFSKMEPLLLVVLLLP